MPRSKKQSGRQRRQEEAELALPTRSFSGHHIHTHELHGFDQVRHLRRRHRAALGYVPREP